MRKRKRFIISDSSPSAVRHLGAYLSYGRDIVEVLFLNRIKASPLQQAIAGEAATIVRRSRFHAHAKIPNVELSEILAQLGEPVCEVVLPGPRDLCGIGNATYYHALASITRAVRPSSVLEFGTYLGVGTLTIALNTPPGAQVTTIDLPDAPSVDDESHGLSLGDLELIERRRTRVGEAFAGATVRDRISQIRADSLTWQPDETLNAVDLVLVDGGHSAPLVKADSENAFRVLSPTGTILWDDYFYLYPGVVGYLESIFDQGKGLYAVRGTNLVIYDRRLQ